MNTPSTLNEQELVSLLRNKEQRAFNYLYDNYSAALYGVVYKVLNSEERAQDVLQEVFVRIWRNMDQYDSSKGRLYTWMLNIARNLAIDTLRSKGYQQSQKTSELEIEVFPEATLGKFSQTNTDTLGLKKLVLNLKPEFRVLIDMAYFQGFTQEEISQTLDIPLGTVKTRLRNALSALKTVFT